MPTFAVRFKGMLNKSELERLERRNIEIVGQEHSLTIGTIKTGVPIYTAHLEADSEDEALERVRMALEPDTGNFTQWETRPA